HQQLLSGQKGRLRLLRRSALSEHCTRPSETSGHAEGEDSLKKMQLMELAILNGTYRDANIKSPTAQAAPRIITGPAPVLPPAALRTPTPAGPTIMPLIRQIQTAVMPNGTPHPTAAIVPPGPEAGLIYTPYEYPYTLAPATSILEYPIEPSGVLGAVATKVRRHDMRVHPYQRVVTADR
ncbi:Protein quaking, partial [Galemys pyrenaicus]